MMGEELDKDYSLVFDDTKSKREEYELYYDGMFGRITLVHREKRDE